MKIAILGHGVEGHAVEDYFKTHPYVSDGQSIPSSELELTVFDHFTDRTLPDLSDFDVVFRSPSVRPHPGWSSSTQYFFDQVDRAHIIGVTGTKGKGTTCSLITTILDHLGYQTFLVGNIGTPAISALDDIAKVHSDHFFIIYEMSSFQLWTLEKSPHVAVVLHISPDHLDVHTDFNEYVSAKSNIARHQSTEDYCIYYSANPDSQAIAEASPGHHIPYPQQDIDRDALETLLDSLQIPGAHNRENAEAALSAVSAALELPLAQLISDYRPQLQQALATFQGLPHRLQFLRELNHVRYYDDNYSSAIPATEVAVQALAKYPTVLIAGGKDRHLDLSEHRRVLFESPSIAKVILIGETKKLLSDGIDSSKYEYASTLKEAVDRARFHAEQAAITSETHIATVLMSPGAASFDMFENFNDRGDQFQKLVQALKSKPDTPSPSPKTEEPGASK